MKSLSTILLLALLALAVTAAAQPSSPPQPSAHPPSIELAAHPDVAARLLLYESWIRNKMAYQHQPGVVVGIVFRQELVWSRGLGNRNVEEQLPATPETLFRVASVTKLFTATAILQLRDRGILRLDDPVVRHLPWFTYRNRFPQGPVVTIRHLLTHTSGLPRESAFPYWTDRRFPSRERLIEALADQENVFEPGTRYKYSNLGPALLGEVVAAASGTSYKDYVTRHILTPLGMTSTRVDLDEVDETLLARGYLRGGAVAPPTVSKGLTPAANITSSLRDLARFVSAHLTASPPLRSPEGDTAEPPILAPSTLREMHRVHWLEPDWQSGRGLGSSVWRHGERTLAGHGGWVAGYRSQVSLDRESGFGVIVLTNSDEGGAGSYARQAFDFVIPAMEKLVGRQDTARPHDPERYVGSYYTPWHELTEFLVIDGQLMMYDHRYPPSSDLEGRLERLVPEGEHAFRRAAPNGNGDPVVFELRGDGRVARVKYGENYLFPADCGEIGDDLRCTWE